MDSGRPSRASGPDSAMWPPRWSGSGMTAATLTSTSGPGTTLSLLPILARWVSACVLGTVIVTVRKGADCSRSSGMASGRDD